MVGSKTRDGVFYDAFDNHAACLVEAAKALASAFENIGEASTIAEKIRDLEHQGDKITHDTIARLHKIWITPFDASDIRSLITALDDVLDLTEAVAERVVLFGIQTAEEDAKQLSQVLVRSCEAVARAIRLLPTIKRSREILDLCVEINRLENEADRAYRHALATLYRTNGSSAQLLDVLKWRDIYDNLEAATDRCEDIANILEGVVLEYS
jgi:predicted phosphate transport protein (TIGR00153 family)